MTMTQRSLGLPLSLLSLGVVGFVAAFALTLDKFALLENPDAQLGCNFSVRDHRAAGEERGHGIQKLLTPVQHADPQRT